jgi:tubulin-specific chaperone D
MVLTAVSNNRPNLNWWTMADIAENEDNVVSSEHAFFEESTEVLAILRDSIACDSPDIERLPSNVEKVVKVFEKYQEQSSLLDPHLENMMEVLTGRSRVIMRELFDKQRSQHGSGEFMFQCERNPQQVAIFQVIYNLCRCRGYKTVVKFFPHEVSDLEPMMFMLQSQDRNDCESWESRYSLLLWLSMLVLVPFDIYTIDSSVGGAVGDKTTGYYGQVANEGFGGLEENQTLVGLILSLCRDYMSDSGPTRDAAAVCLSSLLTRPDMDEHYFLKFIAWAGAYLSQDDLFKTSQNMFLVTGVLMTLTSIFKKGHRDHLLGVVEHLFPHILHLARHENSSTLLRKLLVKLFQRMGMAFLPPRVVSWAYHRGQRSLLQNLTNSGEAGSAAEVADNEEEESIWVPDELEDIVEQLLVGLRDRDTIVRWSAAKGIGRITSRLPKHMADDGILSHDVSFFFFLFSFSWSIIRLSVHAYVYI